MKPMGFNSTQFISYRDIKVQDLDLIEDAWGFSHEYRDVINLLRLIKIEPGRSLTTKLLEKIRNQL